MGETREECLGKCWGKVLKYVAGNTYDPIKYTARFVKELNIVSSKLKKSYRFHPKTAEDVANLMKETFPIKHQEDVTKKIIENLLNELDPEGEHGSSEEND